MPGILLNLHADETGFIISAELILVATVLVIGILVGWSEVQHSVVAELNDVADAFGSLNQSYFFGGTRARKGFGWGIKSFAVGSTFVDVVDDCDLNQCDLTCAGPIVERPKFGGGLGGGHGIYGF